MKTEEKYELLLRQIRDINLYMLELTHSNDIQGLNLYRIYLNQKVMEAVKLKRKLQNVNR